MSLMISISGLRGVIGDTLTPEVAVRYANAFARYCRLIDPVHPAIAVGRDGRITGKSLSDIIVSTILSAGVDVRWLDICPTPTVQLAVEKYRLAGGIAVTASHNPMQWNGMKFIAPSGMFLDAGENQRLWSLADQTPAYAAWDHQGTLSDDQDFLREHIDAVLALPYIDRDIIRRRRFKVVLDCVNAAGGVIVPELLSELGCEVIESACDVSGIFSHTPEPIPENLTGLAAAVKEHKADFGIAVDPDVDRLVLINELGEPYGEEYTISTAVHFVLEQEKKLHPSAAQTVVTNLSTTRAVDDIAAAFGAASIRTPVGEINVASRMKALGAVIGGEGSGGVILPAVHLGRDAIVGIGLILQQFAEYSGTVSEFKQSLPQYAIAKGKTELRGVSPDAVLAGIRDKFAGSGTVNTDDGIKIDFADYWVHLRKSNTEPIVRIIAEATTMEKAREAVARFTREIEKPG